MDKIQAFWDKEGYVTQQTKLCSEWHPISSDAALKTLKAYTADKYWLEFDGMKVRKCRIVTVDGMS